MNIKDELNRLKTKDIYSLMLFALYKASEIREYSTLSQLAYILDKDNLLRLCEFYGGLTIRVPTVEELETIVYALLVFQKVDIEHQSLESTLNELSVKELDIDEVENTYILMKGLLKDYNFNSGRE